MSDMALAPRSNANRMYAFDLPARIPTLAIGFFINKLKQIGVWDRLPNALRRKTKAARDSWMGLKITKTDLDLIPDDTWVTIASELRLEWKRGYES